MQIIKNNICKRDIKKNINCKQKGGGREVVAINADLTSNLIIKV